MKKLIAAALVLPLAAFAETPCHPNETDPDSPRRSKLDVAKPDEIIRLDITGKNGKADIIERWWGGKRVRFFDEAGTLKPDAAWGDTINGAMQVDIDGDGYYDGPADYNVKWHDSDGDGIPDIEVFNTNPRVGAEALFPTGVYFVTIDPENTGMLMDIDWNDMSIGWTRWDTPTNWRSNYHGNATFLKEHIPIWAVENPEYSWENPFLFFDPDGDGLSEVSLRVADERAFIGEGKNRVRFDGLIDEAWVSYDLDNNSGWGTSVSYDFTLNVKGEHGLAYHDDIHDYPGLKAPEWTKPFYRHPDWRQQTRFRYIKRDSAIQRIFSHQWEQATMTFDEDGDSYRWERVELYYPGNPYMRSRKNPNSLIRHPQSDSLGDRAEWDADFSGKGKLYRAAWDGKIHLVGAESGAWLVDRGAKFYGGIHPNGRASKAEAGKLADVILYADTTGDGWINQITYDYDGDKKPERVDDLNALGVPVKGPILDVSTMDWNALRQENAKAANLSWQQAQRLFHAALRHGFADKDVIGLIKAPSVGEKYVNAFWIKEGILRKLLAAAPEAQRSAIIKAHYLNEIPALTAQMEALASARTDP